MATFADLTKQPTRVTTAAGATAQSLWEVLDVSAFDQGDFILVVTGVEGSVTVFTVALETSMQKDTADAWVTVNSFASVISSVPAANLDKKSFTGLLRYLRWKVTTITGGTAVTFTIQGMLRNN